MMLTSGYQVIIALKAGSSDTIIIRSGRMILWLTIDMHCLTMTDRSNFFYSTFVSRFFISRISDFFASISAEMTASEKTSARVSNHVPNGANEVVSER